MHHYTKNDKNEKYTTKNSRQKYHFGPVPYGKPKIILQHHTNEDIILRRKYVILHHDTSHYITPCGVVILRLIEKLLYYITILHAISHLVVW